jgi:cation:H+ antiporter
MLSEVAWLALGLALLTAGGDQLIRGATGLARDLGVSPLVIGLTIVAFGTSAPELAVNVSAALQGRGGISFGNVVGSNLANIGMIVACTALLRPIPIQGTVIAREIPMMLLATAAIAAMGSDLALGDPPNVYTRSDGLLCLLFFLVFVYYTLGDFAKQRGTRRHRDVELPAPGSEGLRGPALRCIAGVIALGLGAHLTVESAVSLARALGVAEVVIALSLVAVGTSLPELVTSIAAALRGESEIAVGNVVGSNIFNLLFVLGVSSALRPIAVPEGGHKDLLCLGALSLLLLAVSLTGNRVILRSEAALLLGSYGTYVGWRAFAS